MRGLSRVRSCVDVTCVQQEQPHLRDRKIPSQEKRNPNERIERRLRDDLWAKDNDSVSTSAEAHAAGASSDSGDFSPLIFFNLT